MSDSVVGLIKIGISASTNNLKKGLTDAKSSVSSFGKDVKKNMSFDSSSMGLSFTGLAGGAATAGIAIVAAAGAAGAALLGMAYSSASAIDRVSELLDKTGSAGEKFTAMAYAANLSGVDVEGLAGSMVKLSKGLADGNDGTAGKALAQMGLSADELRKKDPAEAIKQISDGLRTLPDRASQTAAAMDIFGKSGANMLGFLLQGSAKMEEVEAEAKALGLTFSTLEAANVNDAFDGLSRVGSIFTGIGNEIAIAVSPAIIAASEAVLDFYKNNVNMGETVGTILEMVKSSIIAGAYAFQGLEVAGRLAFAGIMGLTAGLIGAIAAVAQGFAYVTGVGQSTADYLTESAQAAADMAKGSIEGISDVKHGQNTSEFFSNLENSALESTDATNQQTEAMLELAAAQAEANKSASDLVKKLKEQNATFGMTSEQASIFKLETEGASQSIIDEAKALQKSLEQKQKNKTAEDAIKKLEDDANTFGMSPAQKQIEELKKGGATPEQLARANAANEKLTALEAAKKAGEEQKKLQEDMKKQAESVAESVQTPLEKYQTKLQELNKLRDAGLITEDQFAKASENAKNEMPDTATKTAFTGASVGSSEALASIDAARGISNGTAVDVQKNQLAVQTDTKIAIMELVSLARNGKSANLFDLDTA